MKCLLQNVVPSGEKDFVPPKPKFTRDELINTAMALVSEKGADALTARELAQRLGCSTRPIFTVFKDMDELKREVRRVAAKHIDRSAIEAMELDNSFLKAEIRSIHFAMQEPNLYKLVFMSSGRERESFEEFVSDAEIPSSRYADFIQERLELTDDETRELFNHAWTYTLGMGALCAMRNYKVPDDELERLLNADFWAMYERIKSGRLNERTPIPVRPE